MTKELLEKLIDDIYSSEKYSLFEKVVLLENLNLFLRYYDENMKALEEIAEKNKIKNRLNNG